MAISESSLGTDGSTRSGASIGLVSVSLSVASSLDDLKSRRPVSASQSTTPIAQMSARRSSRSPWACSGAM